MTATAITTDSYEPWISRRVIVLWVSPANWAEPSLMTIPSRRAGSMASSEHVTVYVDPICVPFYQEGVDWFWRASAVSLARLHRAQHLAGKALLDAFSWATDAIAVVRTWLARTSPQDVVEAEQLAKAGPVVLPPFEPCCVDMARCGMIAKWLDWEKDAERLAVSNGSVAPAVHASTPRLPPTSSRRGSGRPSGLFV